MLKSLHKFKRKSNGIGLKLSNRFKLEYIPFLPNHLDIEPINICNFKCKHCKVTYWEKEKNTLTLSNFIKIIEQFPYLSSVKLQGLGEPLLNKEFPSFINECVKRDIQIEFFTNGSVFNERLWQKINSTEKIKVKFSIDAGTQETFEKIRSGSDFVQIVKNIRKIVRSYESKYSFWTVLNQNNINEISKIVLLANHLGIVNITLQTYLSDWKSTDVENFNKGIALSNINENSSEIKHAKELASKFGINLNLYFGNYLSKKNKCSWPFTSAFIASKGDVVPCCVISDSNVKSMGNILETPFKEIWNSSDYKELRRSIKTNRLFDFCKGCYGLE